GRLALPGEHPLFVGDDLPRHRRRRHRERRREVEPAGPRAVLVVAVDGRHRDLLRGRRHARTTADARATAGVDDAHARLLEYVHVTAAARVLLHRLRAELDVEVDAGPDGAPGVEGLLHHLRVHVEVGFLARGAAPAV